MIGVRLVQTTVETKAQADSLAENLVERGLAACVQISPVASIYRWQGEVRRAEEFRLDIKTPPDLLASLQAALLAAHPYEIPEIVAVEATASAGYGDWVTAVTASKQG